MNTTVRESRDHSWTILLAAFAGCALLVFAAIFALHHREWLGGAVAGSVASALSAVVSMFVLRRGVRRGTDAIAAAFLASWMIRSAISLGGCVAAIVFWHTPPAPTLLTMSAFYFAVLFVESYIIVNELRSIALQK